MKSIIYITPNEALELIANANLIEAYFESNFEKIKRYHNTVNIWYDRQEVYDWVEEKYLENLYLNYPVYRELLTDYESLYHGQF
jgi:hypothetical protein